MWTEAVTPEGGWCTSSSPFVRDLTNPIKLCPFHKYPGAASQVHNPDKMIIGEKVPTKPSKIIHAMTLDLPLSMTNVPLCTQIYRLAPQKLQSVPAAHQYITHPVLHYSQSLWFIWEGLLQHLINKHHALHGFSFGKLVIKMLAELSARKKFSRKYLRTRGETQEKPRGFFSYF